MTKKDVVDNTDVKMSDILNENIRVANSMDVSTGYFDMGGYQAVRTELEKKVEDPSFRFRMIMGAETVIRQSGFEKLRDLYGLDVERDAFDHNTRFNDDALPLKDRLNIETLTALKYDGINSLIKFLEKKNTHIRLGTNKFNHAKCYIFGDALSSFVGSSNFTGPGLEKNDELNAGLYQPASISITKDWFERIWKKSTDIKNELIDVLKQSKFGTPSEPYRVYMKMLFEEYRDYLNMNKKQDSVKELADFQLKAVMNVKHMLLKFGGAIIADSTGLGKTNMGIEILRQKNNDGRKVLLVAPAQVLNSMWRVKLDDAQLHPKMVSIELLSRMDISTMQIEYQNIDFVLIDESQNFRNKNSNRWKNLMKLIHGIGRRKQIVMLTATPINNTIMDLYYQLCIITNEDDAFFYESTGIRNLYQHMRNAADKDNLSQGLAQIQYLLGKIMVRRTRSHIVEFYSNDSINGKPLVFPVHKHGPIKYSLSDIFGNIYEKIMSDLEKMVGTPYCIEYYDTDRDKSERIKLAGLGKIQTLLLLKRFESSTEAAKISLGHKVTLYVQFQNLLNRGKLLRPSEFNKIMNKWTKYTNDFDSDSGNVMMDEDEYFVSELANVETDIPPSYNINMIKKDLNKDLAILKGILKEVEKVKPEFDKKFEAVRDTIQRDRALEYKERERSGKVLIFSEYKPTVEYLKRRLGHTFDSKVVELINGDTKKAARQRIIEAFAPCANPANGSPSTNNEIDILVSSEVMSEGQNLQDCNYVINYDLPWNPMRMVQRAGRVDRLTSDYNTVSSKACYPDKELEELLKLKARLIDKVQIVNEVIGIDSPLMGEIPKPQQYTGITELLANLAKGKNTKNIMGQLQDQNDLMGSSLLGELDKYVKKIGIGKMHSEPMGRRSGKMWDGQKAVLAYLKTPMRTVYFVIYDYKTHTAKVAPNPDDAIRMVQCAVDDNLHLPMDGSDHRASFIELVKVDNVATTAIKKWLDNVNSYRRKSVQKRNDLHSKNLICLKEILKNAVKRGTIDSDKAGELMRAARSDLRVWQDELRTILDKYEHDDDLGGLVVSIDSMRGRIDRPELDEPDVDDPNKLFELTLVGAMFLSAHTWSKTL